MYVALVEWSQAARPRAIGALTPLFIYSFLIMQQLHQKFVIHFKWIMQQKGNILLVFTNNSSQLTSMTVYSK